MSASVFVYKRKKSVQREELPSLFVFILGKTTSRILFNLRRVAVDNILLSYIGSK